MNIFASRSVKAEEIPRLNRTKVWLIDLDDTVLKSSGGLFQELHRRMNVYLMKHLGLTEKEASALRVAYWRRYGTTFLGLWRHHGIDPVKFLTETHDFDVAPHICVSRSPGKALSRLPGKKILYTNAPRFYAEAAVKHLRIGQFFDDMVTATDTHILGSWEPKPSGKMIEWMLARFDVSRGHAAMVDDSFANLRTAKRKGLRTVCCYGYRTKGSQTHAPRRPAYVDAMIPHLLDLLRIA